MATIVLMGEIRVAKSPEIISTFGIGSCVAVCLYDRVRKIGGLAHIMSPSSKGADKKGINMNRFADVAIPNMLEEMTNLGCRKENIAAIIVGGANMFRRIPEILLIGKKNLESVRRILKGMGIRIIGEDTGGNSGRNLWFDTSNGSVVVSGMHRPTIEISGD